MQPRWAAGQQASAARMVCSNADQILAKVGRPGAAVSVGGSGARKRRHPRCTILTHVSRFPTNDALLVLNAVRRWQLPRLAAPVSAFPIASLAS